MAIMRHDGDGEVAGLGGGAGEGGGVGVVGDDDSECPTHPATADYPLTIAP